MTFIAPSQLAVVVLSLQWQLSEMCIYCAPPPPTRWTTTRTTPMTRPTRPTFTTRPTRPPPPPPTTTPPWDIIPPVINPNIDDEVPSFTAIIATVNDQPVCSATIIAKHFLLSSCIRCLQKSGRPIARDSIRIIVGDYSDEETGVGLGIYEVKTVALHPDCLQDGRYNVRHDLGLVQTLEEIEFSSSISPAKIPEEPGFQPDTAKNWFLAAFRIRNTISITPRESVWFVKVRYVKPSRCRLVLNSTFYDETYNYCTPYEHIGRTDGCWDDFGASLSIGDTLIGILIHKFACGRAGAAGSFVNVAYNSEWIRKTIQKLNRGEESV